MVKTKSVYEPKGADDGLRLLVTRYWPRGVPKDAVDRWFKELGTSPELIKRWKAGRISWEGFRESYIAEFSAEVKSGVFSELQGIVKGAAAVTLLCVCKDEARCHRGILIDMLERGVEN
jgi:uncharacterized protein YeaO (DUF488 family)